MKNITRNSYKNLLVIGGIVAALGVILVALSWTINKNTDMVQLAVGMLGMVGIFALVAAMMYVIDKAKITSAGPMFKVVIEVLGILALLVAAIGAIGWVLQKVDPNGALLGYIDKVGELFYGIGYVIAQPIRGVVRGLAGLKYSDEDSVITKIAKDFSNFAELIGPFVEGMGSIKEDTLSKATMLGDALKSIASSVIDYSATYQADDLKSLLTLTTGAVIGFVNSFKSFDQTTLDKAQSGIAIIRDLGQTLNDIVPKSGGLLQMIMGTQDIGWFGTGLTSLASGIKDFITTGLYIKDGDVSRLISQDELDAAMIAIEAMRTIMDVCKEIPTTGGIIGVLSGEDSKISNFATGMGELGTGLATMKTNLGAFSEDDKNRISIAVEAIKDCCAASDAIWAAHGSQFYGGIQMTEALTNTMPSVVAFAEAASGLTFQGAASIKNASTAVISIADAMLAIKSVGEDNKGLDPEYVNNVVKPTTIDQYKAIWEKVNECMPYVISFIEYAKMAGDTDVDVSPFTNVICKWASAIAAFNPISDDTVNRFYNFFKLGPGHNIAGVLSAFIISFKSVDDEDFDKACSQIERILNIMKGYAAADISTFTSLSDTLVSMGETGIGAFEEKFRTSYNDVDSTLKNFVGHVCYTIAVLAGSQMVTAGEALAEQFELGIVNGAKHIYQAASYVRTQAIRGLNGMPFESYGRAYAMTKTNEILTNYLDNVQISTETAEATGEAMAEGFTQAAEANAPNTSNVIDWGDAVTGYFVDTAKDASANWMQSNGYGKYVDTAKAAQDAVTDNGLSGTSDSGIFGYGLNIEYMEVLTSDPTKTAGDIIRNVEYEANKLTGSTSLFGGWSGQ